MSAPDPRLLDDLMRRLHHADWLEKHYGRETRWRHLRYSVTQRALPLYSIWATVSVVILATR